MLQVFLHLGFEYFFSNPFERPESTLATMILAKSPSSLSDWMRETFCFLLLQAFAKWFIPLHLLHLWPFAGHLVPCLQLSLPQRGQDFLFCWLGLFSFWLFLRLSFSMRSLRTSSSTLLLLDCPEAFSSRAVPFSDCSLVIPIFNKFS